MATRGRSATLFVELLPCPVVIDFTSGFSTGLATRGRLVATLPVEPLPCPEVCVAADDCWVLPLMSFEPVTRLNCGAFIPPLIEPVATCGHFRINV